MSTIVSRTQFANSHPLSLSDSVPPCEVSVKMEVS
jgi:hypothetical protein